MEIHASRSDPALMSYMNSRGLLQSPLQSSWALTDIAHVRAANSSCIQAEVHDPGCCQSSIIQTAKLLAQQKPVIAKLGKEDHIASYYL